MADPSADHLKSLADMRLKDAAILLQNGRHSAAYYLAGYAIEAGLKAVIAVSFRATVIPSPKFVAAVHTHDLVSLVSLSGLKEPLMKATKIDRILAANWGFVAGWKETSRYETIDPFSADRMLTAIGDPSSGVMQWLKTHW